MLDIMGFSATMRVGVISLDRQDVVIHNTSKSLVDASLVACIIMIEVLRVA